MVAKLSNRRNSEVVIIGAGPAGLSAGISLARMGARCTVVDHARLPIDKACGEGLMPDSRLALAQLGVSIPEAGHGVFSGIRFNRGIFTVEASFPQGRGVGVRRTHLHRALVQRAAEVGVNLMWNSRVKLLENGKISVDNEPVEYEWLIGADGLNSAVRKWAGLDIGEKVFFRYGARRHYRVNLWTDRMEIYWSECGQMYVTPVDVNEICVVFLSRNRDLRFDQAMPQFALLAERLAGASPVDNIKGAVTATRQLKEISRGRVVLLGDACGSVDAITGEGLALSFRQSIALADAISRDDLPSYCRKQKQLALLPTRMANLMLLLDRYPGLQERALDALSRTPETFGKLLSSHVGHDSLALTLATEIPKFAWKFLLSSAGIAKEVSAI